jgi:hypothetical protein
MAIKLAIFAIIVSLIVSLVEWLLEKESIGSHTLEAELGRDKRKRHGSTLSTPSQLEDTTMEASPQTNES